MTEETFVLLSGALTFGAPLAIAIHELIALRRPPRGGWSPPAPDPIPPAPKPLPDCLVPKLRPRVRVLEDA